MPLVGSDQDASSLCTTDPTPDIGNCVFRSLRAATRGQTQVALRTFRADLDRRDDCPDHHQLADFSGSLAGATIFERLNAFQHLHRLAIDAEGEHHAVPALECTFQYGAVIILNRIKHALVKGDLLLPIGMGDADSEGDLHCGTQRQVLSPHC